MADQGIQPPKPADSPSNGPSFAPPQLPLGWIAQWDPKNKRYYFVQPSTGTTTWEVPQHPSSAANSPAPHQNPYPTPGPEQQYGAYQVEQTTVMQTPGGEAHVQSTRAGGFGGIAGSMAQNLLSGGGKHGKQSGGLGGLASGLLSGGKHSSGSGSSSGGGGLTGLAGSLLGGGGKHNKPGKQSGAAGLIGLAGDFLVSSSEGQRFHELDG